MGETGKERKKEKKTRTKRKKKNVFSKFIVLSL